MLVLTRYVGEKIVFGDGEIQVAVLSHTGQHKNGVRLGIVAPDHVTVHREEVYWRVKQTGRQIERVFPIKQLPKNKRFEV